MREKTVLKGSYEVTFDQKLSDLDKQVAQNAIKDTIESVAIDFDVHFYRDKWKKEHVKVKTE